MMLIIRMKIKILNMENSLLCPELKYCFNGIVNITFLLKNVKIKFVRN